MEVVMSEMADQQGWDALALEVIRVGNETVGPSMVYGGPHQSYNGDRYVEASVVLEDGTSHRSHVLATKADLRSELQWFQHTQCDPPASVSERSDAAQGWADEPLWLGGER